jgi:hypothetical protein
MATRDIPTFQDGDGHVKYTVQLEGVLYHVYLDWNSREEKWYISVHDSADQPIEGCICRKLVTNWKILRGATVDERPPGEIYTSSTGHADPGLLELGARVALYYVEST